MLPPCSTKPLPCLANAALAVLTLLAAQPHCVVAADHVTIRQGDNQQQLTGKVVVTAQDGGLMLMTTDGLLWTVPPEELVEHRIDEQPFVFLSMEELGRKLLAELPEGFETHTTAHYLVCHNTSRAYAHWCGGLFERLYKAFTNFWSQRGFKLHKPELPLVVLVFADQESYAAFSAQQQVNSDGIIGYYNLRTNHVMMYDLTGAESLRQPGDRRGSTAQINQMLRRPQAAPMVATVVHEATHQIAFNCGLQQRFADIPLWVSEGMAIYFETPDLSSSKGWRTIGAVNQPRLVRFRTYLANRPADSLLTLLADDKRFRDAAQAADAYAEAWAFNYFLLRQRPKQYRAYLEVLAAKGPLVADDPAERLKEFKTCFGDDLKTMDAEFLRHIQRLR